MSFSNAPMVSFTDSKGYSFNVAPVSASNSTLVVSVPPYFDPTQSGALGGGSVSVQVMATINRKSLTSNSMSFQIQAPPSLPAGTPSGLFSLAALQAFMEAAPTLQSGLITSLNVPTARIAISNAENAATTLVPNVGNVLDGSSSSADLGSIGGNEFLAAPADLAVADRLFLSLFQALANQQPQQPPFLSLNALDLLHFFRLDDQYAWAGEGGGCLQSEAQKTLDDALQCNIQGTCLNQVAGDINKAAGDANGVPACYGQAGVQAVTYISAWTAAMAALSTGIEEAGVAVAQASGVLTYIQTSLAGVLVQVGATNGQDNQSDRQLVSSGAELLNQATENAISAVVKPGVEGPISVTYDAYNATKGFIDSLSGSSPPPTCSGITPDSCNGVCTDLNTDPNNCGGCGSACTVDSANGSFSAICSFGFCNQCFDDDRNSGDFDEPDCD